MKVKQFVMAYSVEQDRLRALLPKKFSSLRPVLRMNAEIRDNKTGFLELNTAVERENFKGWLNIAKFYDVPFHTDGKTTVFETDFIKLSFTQTGIVGSCPAEKDNDGCYVRLGNNYLIFPPEHIDANKEFCGCEFAWHFKEGNACGVSTGKSLPAVPTESRTKYLKQALTAENAAQIPCLSVLGSYTVSFER